LEDAIVQHCQTVYQDSDFKTSVPAVTAIYENYKAQNPTVPTPKLKHFCEYVKKAEKVQTELGTFLPTFMKPLNNIASITQTDEIITNENTQNLLNH